MVLKEQLRRAVDDRRSMTRRHGLSAAFGLRVRRGHPIPHRIGKARCDVAINTTFGANKLVLFSVMTEEVRPS
jgi:hypothetical protein